jgi:hypothetical protein
VATTYKILGQQAAAATTNAVLYTSPSVTQTVVSTVVISNSNASSRTFRLYVMSAADVVTYTSTVPQAQHYIAYDVTVGANDATALTLGITLGAGDVIGTYASAASSLAFSAYGAQIA